MARTLLSFYGRVKGGPARGGTGRTLRFYTDDTLVVAKTLYQRETGAGLQPVVIVPNAGIPRPLLADRAVGDTFVTVPLGQTGSYNVGDLVPIWNPTQGTVYRVITVITPATGRLDLDSALGVAFTVANGTQVNATDMEGHVWGWPDDATATFLQVTELASGRVLAPVKLASAAPSTSTAYQEEGVLVNSRATVNFVGIGVTVTDDGANNRVNVTVAAQVADVQKFTASGTWTKPTGAKWVEVIGIGGGGGGAGGAGLAAGTNRGAGGGGGGGAWRHRLLDPSVLGATETVTVGAGGTAGASGAAGGAGGTSSLGSHVSSFGGGAGDSGGNEGGQGGGGGGSAGAGSNGISGAGAGQPGGAPYNSALGANQLAGAGGKGSLGAAVGGNAELGGGGAGGGGGSLGPASGAGASSISGAGAGGGGGRVSIADVESAGAAGGAHNSYVVGGGGAAGAVNGGAGTAGTSRSGTGKCGDGGGGGGGQDSGTGGVGGAGGLPGGGGGGGGGGTSTGGAGAAGGRGEVIVVTYF